MKAIIIEMLLGANKTSYAFILLSQIIGYLHSKNETSSKFLGYLKYLRKYYSY